MLSHDYFMQTHQMLIENKRFKEFIDLCEYAITSAVWTTPMERQCEALCRWALANAYYHNMGDAKRARNGYISFLKYIDSDISMIKAVPSLREVMEDMYVKACMDMGQLAISYDEYFYYIKKIATVRPLTQKQKGIMDGVKFNRDNNQSWWDNVVQLTNLENDSIKSGDKSRLPYALAMHSLVLNFPEVVDGSDEQSQLYNLIAAIKTYEKYLYEFLLDCFDYCVAKHHPIIPENYRFIFEEAIALVQKHIEDMETHDIAAKIHEDIVEFRQEFRDSIAEYNHNFKDYIETGPEEVRDLLPPRLSRKLSIKMPRMSSSSIKLSIPSDYIQPYILQGQIKQNLSKTASVGSAGSAGLPNSGCVVVFTIMLALGSIVTIIALILSYFR